MYEYYSGSFGCVIILTFPEMSIHSELEAGPVRNILLSSF